MDHHYRDLCAEVHPELQALVKGAWLYSPVPRAPRRKLFFQLSRDASTLRWSWRGFLRTYYIDEVVSSRSRLTLTLATTVTKDLTLKFPDEARCATVPGPAVLKSI